jgi:hypothetical protein
VTKTTCLLGHPHCFLPQHPHPNKLLALKFVFASAPRRTLCKTATMTLSAKGDINRTSLNSELLEQKRYAMIHGKAGQTGYWIQMWAEWKHLLTLGFSLTPQFSFCHVYFILRLCSVPCPHSRSFQLFLWAKITVKELLSHLQVSSDSSYKTSQFHSNCDLLSSQSS